jgi:hypothetical protein
MAVRRSSEQVESFALFDTKRHDGLLTTARHMRARSGGDKLSKLHADPDEQRRVLDG